jgi:hypothetical protein
VPPTETFERDQAVNIESLDLIGQLLVRARRWEFVGAAALLAGTFVLGGSFVAAKMQFTRVSDGLVTLAENQTALKDALDAMMVDLNGRTAERHRNEAAAEKVDASQDAAIQAMQAAITRVADSVLQLAEAGREHEKTDRDRDKEFAEVKATQKRVVDVLDLIVKERIGPHP